MNITSTEIECTEYRQSSSRSIRQGPEGGKAKKKKKVDKTDRKTEFDPDAGPEG